MTTTSRAKQSTAPGVLRVSAEDRSAVEAMRFPLTAPDGRVFDGALTRTGNDPFFDPCEPWCEHAAEGHRHVESHNDDRVHYGERLSVPLGRMTAEDVGFDHDEELVVWLATASMWLERTTGRRVPTIWLGQGENGGGFKLSMDEADEIGRTLLALAAQGRGEATA